MLVEDTERTMEADLSTKRGDTTDERRRHIFNQKVLRGDLRGAVHYITEREKGGVLMPDDVDETTGDTVFSVLKSKHPDARTPDSTHLPSYKETPELIDLDITVEVVE